MSFIKNKQVLEVEEKGPASGSRQNNPKRYTSDIDSHEHSSLSDEFTTQMRSKLDNKFVQEIKSSDNIESNKQELKDPDAYQRQKLLRSHKRDSTGTPSHNSNRKLHNIDTILNYIKQKEEKFKTESINKHMIAIQQGLERNKQTILFQKRTFCKDLQDLKTSLNFKRQTNKQPAHPHPDPPHLGQSKTKKCSEHQINPIDYSSSAGLILSSVANSNNCATPLEDPTPHSEDDPDPNPPACRTPRQLADHLKDSSFKPNFNRTGKGTTLGAKRTTISRIKRANSRSEKHESNRVLKMIEQPIQTDCYQFQDKILRDQKLIKKQGISKQKSEKSTPIAQYNEHEFNTIFKIINYLDKEADLSLKRKELRKTLKSMKERANEESSTKDDDEETCLTHYNISEILGEGSYAIVKLAHLKSEPHKRFAIKIYRKARLLDQLKLKNLELEIEILSSIHHPNIIKLFDKVEGAFNIFLVMEYVSRNSLQDFLDFQPNKCLSEPKAVRFFLQLVKAVNYLHSQNIVHRDLKLQNILIDNKLNLKLIDFGFAVRVEPSTLLKVYCGTPSYMSPEIVSRTPYQGKASDIWALGCVLYKILFSRFPFRGSSEENLFNVIRSGSFEIPNTASPNLKALLTGMLSVNLSQRLTSSEILEHPWITENYSKDIEETRHDLDSIKS